MNECGVRDERIKQGFSLRDLAKRAGLSISTLSEIENSKTDPRLSSVRKICKALDRYGYELWPEQSTGEES